MYTVDEMRFFQEQGYLHAHNVLSADELAFYRTEFDRIWEIEGKTGRVWQYQLLKYQSFIDLIEHPNILGRMRAVFGNQSQLIAYDLLRQGPENNMKERSWHRDFTFPGDRPLAINTILYMDEMTDERGPTRVVPRTHLGEQYPPQEQSNEPLPGEVACYGAAGDACFINGAIWHTGGKNKTNGLRRGIFLYYGYWWLKRYNEETALPWQALQNASEARLKLLGVKMPDRDLHMYDPTK
jgi:ectoine hydroxylase-related dioxygenase (phytanoyl-CoA dioxygenase family)